MAAPEFRMVSAQESGIGGFLLLFVLTELLSVGIIVLYIAGMFEELAGTRTGFEWVDLCPSS